MSRIRARQIKSVCLAGYQQEKGVNRLDESAQRKWTISAYWASIATLIIVPFIAHFPGLIGIVNSNPAILYSGTATELGKSILPGLAYADPNVGFTSQALGHLAAVDWLKGTVPWWNPYEGVGTPLAGEMQSAAFFPLVLLLYFANGQLYFHIALQIIAGVSTWAFLRRFGFSTALALLGGLLFELNGTFAWFGHAPVNPVAFLPMMLLGVEAALSDEGHWFTSWRWLSLGIALSIYAGFPETAYIDGLMVVGWAIVRATSLRQSGLRRFVVRMLLGGGIGLALASPLLVAFLSYLKHGFVGGHAGAFAFAHISVAGLPLLVLPYLYGPIAALSSFDPSGSLAPIWGSVGGYVTASLLFAAIAGCLTRGNVSIKLFLGGWIVLCLLKTFGQPLATGLWDLIPLVSNAAFFRYSPPTWEFAFIMLSLFGIQDLREMSRTKILGVFALFAILLTGVLLESVDMITTLWTAPHYAKGVFLVAGYLLIVLLTVAIAALKRKSRYNFLGLILVIDCFLNFLVPRLSNPTSGEIDAAGPAFLKIHLGDQRFYSLGPIAPNYGSYYDIASVNHNDLPVPSAWAQYVNTALNPNSGRILFTGTSERDPQGPSPVQALRKFLPNYRWVGVKYVVVPSGTSNPLVPTVDYGNMVPGNVPFILEGKTVLRGSLAIRTGGEVDSFSIFIGNYRNTATGDVSLSLSIPRGGSVSGVANLRLSHDNSYLRIPLQRPLKVRAGWSANFTIIHSSGHPVAVWLWPSQGTEGEQIRQTSSVTAGRVALIALSYKSASAVSDPLVYHDSTMDIYELPGYAHFYSFSSPGYKLEDTSWNHVTISVGRKGTLVRRELYFPGWSASVNGRSEPILPYKGLFESVTLPPGRSVVSFSYAPPGSREAEVAMFLSILALLYPSLRELWRKNEWRRVRGHH